MLYFAIFLIILTAMVSILWSIRVVRVWNGTIKTDNDAILWIFVIITALGFTLTSALLIGTLRLFTGV